jgi:hypothetical protein
MRKKKETHKAPNAIHISSKVLIWSDWVVVKDDDHKRYSQLIHIQPTNTQGPTMLDVAEAAELVRTLQSLIHPSKE